MKVYVVTCRELGWDCVVGAFDSYYFTEEEIKEAFPIKLGYDITECKLRTSLED